MAESPRILLLGAVAGILVILFSGLALAVEVGAIPPGAAADSMLARVKVLTSAELEGRGSGTPAAEAAASQVGAWFSALGLTPAFSGSFWQEFPLAGENWAGQDIAGLPGRNVGGILRGNGKLAERFVIVGAHFDHLGVVREQPPDSSGAEVTYYPGANDNASGVAAMLELARLAVLRNGHEPGPADCRSLLFVSFDAEEIGLQGSNHLATHLPVSADCVDAMVNLDTVGQVTDGRLFIGGVGTTPVFAEILDRIDTRGLDLALTQGGWSGSDHMSFNLQEIPVLFLFSGPYLQYNRPTDDWPTLNMSELAKVVDMADGLLQELRTLPGPLPWVQVSAPKLETDQEEGESNRSTWFGSIPDFSPGIKGYKLGGVFDGSPAARAGLQKGDILVKLGGREVEDLPTFTSALRAHAPGDLVEVTVIREGRSVNFTVVLGDRKDL